jgi:hypothetical protein
VSLLLRWAGHDADAGVNRQNERDHLVCAACTTPKGETSYRER